jgi:uncharacterized protein YnzC (UPF0291/DUF896 family)
MNFDVVNKDWLLEKLSNEQSMMEFVSFIDSLLEPNFSIAALNLTRQELNLWKVEGLIKSNDSELREWVRVNFFDFIWLKMVDIMRQSKIPFSAINKIKKEFFEINDEDLKQLLSNSFNQGRGEIADNEVMTLVQKEVVSQDYPPAVIALFKRYFPPFNLFIFGLMIDRSPINILVNTDGETVYLNPNQLAQTNVTEALVAFLSKPFIGVPMHTLLDDFYDNPKIKLAEQQQVCNLTKLETKVLGLLRKENIKEIRIRFNQQLKGEIIIEHVNYVNPDMLLKNVHQILERGKYSTIKIVQEDGRIKIFEEVIKEKIKNIN